MLRSFCLNVVTASAVIVCVGFFTSACLFRGRDAHGEDRGDHRGEHHEEHHDEHHDDGHH
jgi:hypothetical protein